MYCEKNISSKIPINGSFSQNSNIACFKRDWAKFDSKCLSGVVIIAIIIVRLFLNEKKEVRWMEEFLNGQGNSEISFVRCYQWWMDGWVLISIILGYPSSGSSFSFNSTRESEIAQEFFLAFTDSLAFISTNRTHFNAQRESEFFVKLKYLHLRIYNSFIK